MMYSFDSSASYSNYTLQHVDPTSIVVMDVFTSWSTDPSLCVGPVCATSVMHLQLRILFYYSFFVSLTKIKAESTGVIVMDLLLNCESRPDSPLLSATGTTSSWNYGGMSVTVI